MENNKNKKSVKFQGDMLNFCDFIQVFVFTRNYHLKLRQLPSGVPKIQRTFNPIAPMTVGLGETFIFFL